MANHATKRCHLGGHAGNGVCTTEELFIDALYVHPNNEPKYQAIQTRAREFAKRHHECILWIKARVKAKNDHERPRGAAARRERGAEVLCSGSASGRPEEGRW